MPIKVLKSPEIVSFFQQADDDYLNTYLTVEEIAAVNSGTLTDLQILEIYKRNKSVSEFLDLFRGEFIPETLIIKMAKTDYQQRLGDHIPSNGRRLQISKCCYFSLGEIQDFISKNGLNNRETHGMRVYFAVTDIKPTPPADISITCILVPTEVRPTMNPANGQTINVPNDFANEVSIGGAFDHGDLCPNECLGTDYT